MPAPAEILQLVERFNLHRETYLSPRYNETQLRREFVDPFFKALGWDIDNAQGYAEAYKDVVHEDAIKIGGATKAPDYSFRIGGARKFFVETKKPSLRLKDDPSPAFQLRRYAWSAKLPLSILTDFEEFAVYNCRVRPDNNDKASKERTLYIRHEEYADRWDEIADVFSREAILRGSFDKYAESKKKRGTAEVDTEFLKEIEGWRDALARNLALRNSDLGQRELNFAVQRTIDRIIFLRICEDRGIEPPDRLRGVTNGPNIYKRLCQLFEQADDRYNSGLFHFHREKDRAEAPDELTLSLNIDDKVLRDIIGHLYYPESPYEFSVFPAEILGQVYEQFLGKVIVLTSGHRARVDDKPEVKKAGGVYYTPAYIVEYIVEKTVGKLLEGKTPQEVGGLTDAWKPSKTRRPLAILDPACGSGSFLIGAYQKMLDWHRDWYTNNDPAKWLARSNPPIYEGPRTDPDTPNYRLTTAERKRILLSNIYGVDIDPQAVEVTKLSLLLKVLEGETRESLQRQLFARERALPDLGRNIKCGNSLIGPDFYDTQQLELFGDEERLRINVFDWQTEFPEIMNSGAFDGVIGNPPWVSLSGKFGVDSYTPAEIQHLIGRFRGNTYMPNMYEYFVSNGLELTRPGGLFSLVVPDRLGFNDQFIALRHRILSEATILSLLYRVPFPGVTADTVIFLIEMTKADASHRTSLAEFGRPITFRAQSELLDAPTRSWEYFENAGIMELAHRIASLDSVLPLSQLCNSTSGFGGKSELITSTQVSPSQIPTLKGDSIGRYELRRTYWFDFCRANITGRTTDRQKLGASPRILMRKTGATIVATYDESTIFPEQSLYFLFNKTTELDYRYILGLLNSSLLNAYFSAKCLTNRRSIAQVKKVDLDQLPIATVQLHSADKERHDRIVELVKRMLILNEQLGRARTHHEQTALKRQIAATDRQIDQLVYELYGLTDEEIRIVEDATATPERDRS